MRRRVWLIEWLGAKGIVELWGEAWSGAVVKDEGVDGKLAGFSVQLKLEAFGEERLDHQAELIPWFGFD